MKFSFPYCEGTFDYFRSNPKMIEYVNDICFSDNKIFQSAGKHTLAEAHWNELLDISEKLNIKLNYIINPSFYDAHLYFLENKKELAAEIRDLKKVGISIITFNNPMLIKDSVIKDALSNYEVKNSVDNMITSLEQVYELVEGIGLESIFLGRDINRNMSEIKRIKKHYPNLKIHLLCNDNCYTKCVYKQSCDVLTSTPRLEGDLKFNNQKDCRTSIACDQVYLSMYQNLANNVIFPSQIKEYKGYVDVINITGILKPIEHMSKIFEAYVKEDNSYILESIYNGLILPDSYYDYTLNCKNKCVTCKVCSKIAEDYENKKSMDCPTKTSSR